MVYGTWITPTGKTIIVEELCGHNRYCPLEDADEQGWIATIEPDPNDSRSVFCARFNKDVVTTRALRVLLRRLMSYEGDSACCDNIWTTETYAGLGKCPTKPRCIAFVRQLIGEKLSERPETASN